MRENLRLPARTLSPEDIEALSDMENIGYSGTDPDSVNFSKGG